VTDKETRPNWVERKSTREANLKDHAEDVWQNVRAAIQDCCESFRKHYNGDIKDDLENGMRIRITVPYRTAPKQTILVSFNQARATIEVTTGASATKAYHIDADETHAFITDDNHKEVNADQFTQLTLESPLTKPSGPPRNTRP
jgi:hypothetical protein